MQKQANRDSSAQAAALPTPAPLKPLSTGVRCALGYKDVKLLHQTLDDCLAAAEEDGRSGYFSFCGSTCILELASCMSNGGPTRAQAYCDFYLAPAATEATRTAVRTSRPKPVRTSRPTALPTPIPTPRPTPPPTHPRCKGSEKARNFRRTMDGLPALPPTPSPLPKSVYFGDTCGSQAFSRKASQPESA